MAINSNGTKWGAPTLGSAGGQVAWSFASPVSTLTFATHFADAASFQPYVRAAFDLWEEIADIDFVETGRAGAQIEIGWSRIDGLSNTLGQAQWSYRELGAMDTTISADVDFDMAERWNVGSAATPQGTDFFAVAVHEIGHAIGLGHSDDPQSLMYFRLDDQHGPSGEDRAAIQEIYGAHEEAPPASGLQLAAAEPEDIFRFYNESTGSHFFTNSATERDTVIETLAQFRYEGNAFDVPTGEAASLEVFRFFNTATGTHFYTADAAERDTVIATLTQFRFEGVAYHAAATDDGGALEALHRFYNTANETHFFTASEDEMITVLGTLPQYRYEGIAYYVDAA